MTRIAAWFARHRLLAELLHIAAGLVVTALLANLAIWSVPSAAGSIELVAWLVALAVVVMAVVPLRRAWAADRERHADA